MQKTIIYVFMAGYMGPLSSIVYPNGTKVLQKLLHVGREKGFTLRYNSDLHWSAALYRGLKVLQCTYKKTTTISTEMMHQGII